METYFDKILPFIASEPIAAAALPSVKTITNLLSSPNVVALHADVRKTVALFQPLYDLMSHLSGQKEPLAAWKVNSQIRTVAEHYQAASPALAKEIAKRWVPHKHLWTLVALFSPVATKTLPASAKPLSLVSDMRATGWQYSGDTIALGQQFDAWWNEIHAPGSITAPDPITYWSSRPDCELKDVALTYLLLKPSTARVEGFFSLMSRVVNGSRGRMTPETASSVLFLAANSRLPDEFWPTDVLPQDGGVKRPRPDVPWDDTDDSNVAPVVSV